MIIQPGDDAVRSGNIGATDVVTSPDEVIFDEPAILQEYYQVIQFLV